MYLGSVLHGRKHPELYVLINDATKLHLPQILRLTRKYNIFNNPNLHYWEIFQIKEDTMFKELLTQTLFVLNYTAIGIISIILAFKIYYK